MKRMRHRLFLAAMLLACMLSISVAQGAPALPVWPQSFALRAGQVTKFGIPITQPGKITIEIGCEGSRLDATLTDASGKLLARPSDSAANPLSIVYSANAAVVGAGTVLFLSLSAPGVPVQGDIVVVRGKIQVTSPEVDVVKLAAAAAALSRQIKPRGTPSTGTLPETLLAAKRNAETRRVAAVADKILVEAKPKMEAFAVRVTAVQKGEKIPIQKISGALKGVSGHSKLDKSKLDKSKLTLNKDPFIYSTAPDSVAQGDKMTVYVVNVKPTIADNQFVFSFTAQGSAPKPSGSETRPDSATPLDDGSVAFDVVVPQAYLYDRAATSKVSVKDLSRNPMVSSPSADFKYLDEPVAKASKITPAEVGAGEWQTLTGTDYTPQNTVFYWMGQGAWIVAQMQYVSPTQIKAQVPTYSSSFELNGCVSVNTKTKNGMDYYCPSLPILLKPTIKPVITSTSGTAGAPGDPVLINGTGFASPLEVHFLTGSGANDVIATNVKSVTDTQILAYVPDTVRPKSASDTLIYVQIAKQKSNFIAYKITPNYDYATLSLSDYDQSKCVIFTMGFMGESNASWSIDKDRYDADWAGKRGDLWGQHRGGRSTGYNGNDEYYKGIALQNNWVVDDIQFNVWDQPWNPRPIIPSDGMVILQESHNGTNLPYLNVRWAVNPYYNIVSYEIIVTIKGPRGYSWK